MFMEYLRLRDKRGLLKKFNNILVERYSEDDVIEKGKELYEDWMLLALDFVEDLPIEVKDKTDQMVGLRYVTENTIYEFSEKYHYNSGFKYRVPVSFKVNLSGVYYKDTLISAIPIIVESVLHIANGKYQSIYKLKNIQTDKSFVTVLDDIGGVSERKMAGYLKKYISLGGYFNSLIPKLISIKTYE